MISWILTIASRRTVLSSRPAQLKCSLRHQLDSLCFHLKGYQCCGCRQSNGSELLVSVCIPNWDCNSERKRSLKGSRSGNKENRLCCKIDWSESAVIKLRLPRRWVREGTTHRLAATKRDAHSIHQKSKSLQDKSNLRPISSHDHHSLAVWPVLSVMIYAKIKL